MSGRVSSALGVLGVLAFGCGGQSQPETTTPPSPQPSHYSYADLTGPEPETLELASTVWPPFTDRQGQPRVAIELVERALSGAGYRTRTTVLGPDVETDEHLRDDSFDGSAAVWRTAEREEYLRFSEPFLENRIVVVGPEGADVSASSLADLEGQRVGIVSGYAYGEAVGPDRGAELVEGASTSDNLHALLDGELDYALADDLVVHYLLELHPEGAERTLDVGENPITRRTLHLAIRKDHPKADAIIDAFNGRIQQMAADGTYNDVLHLRWIRADADGDGELELVLAGSKAGEAPPEHAYQVTPGDKATDSDSVYYIEGESYDSFEALPSQYEGVPPPPPSPGHYGIGADLEMEL
ncbi:MAG: substrate-binding periplasmic protein [Polyangiales bacterium]